MQTLTIDTARMPHLLDPVRGREPTARHQRCDARGPGASARAAGSPRPDQLVFVSPAMRRLRSQIAAVADSDAAVIIIGESGTGKELVCQTLHALSKRRGGPFVAVNCAAFAETLVEDELFGHVRGAFTGAATARLGRFQAADGGTLFLDEIAEMPLATQAKLLRVLETRPSSPSAPTSPCR